MRNTLFVAALIFFTGLASAQYGYRDGNRIGISAGISQTTLFTDNFNATPEIGFAGGLSVRGNYYNNWSMIYGMQFFYNKFSVESTTNDKIEYNVQGAKIRILGSYNVVEDHVSIDFGPVLQINGKLQYSSPDKGLTIDNTLLKTEDIEEVSPVSGNFYLGCSAGGRRVRAVIFYEYGFTNFLNKLNKNDDLKALNNGDEFKGNLGVINAQVIFNL